ncbi:hypothetical protein MRB53_041491 [Persea americana]|nr:hypothetical protein MRB53_041491 [Persea americana]
MNEAMNDEPTFIARASLAKGTGVSSRAALIGSVCTHDTSRTRLRLDTHRTHHPHDTRYPQRTRFYSPLPRLLHNTYYTYSTHGEGPHPILLSSRTQRYALSAPSLLLPAAPSSSPLARHGEH